MEQELIVDSLCQLWGEAAVIVSSIEMFVRLNKDCVIPLNPLIMSQTLEHFTSPLASPVKEGSQLFQAVPVTEQSSGIPSTFGPTSFTTLNGPTLSAVDDQPLLSPSPPPPAKALTSPSTNPASLRIPSSPWMRSVTKPPSRSAKPLSLASSSTPGLSDQESSVKLVMAYYLCEACRTMEHDLNTLATISEGHLSNEPIRVLLQRLKESSERLFPLLPRGRLSDYIVPSETTSTNLDEAAKEAAQLLTLVEDLYMVCAGERRLKIDRGPVVSLERLRKLSSVFAEPTDEDRGHLSFLETCFTSPQIMLGNPQFTPLEDALRALLRIRPMKSRLRELVLQRETVLNSEAERRLLFSIAAQLSTALDQKTSRNWCGSCPLFSMLTAPFILLSGVGTSELVADVANTSAESVLKGHANGPLSGFRYFAPIDLNVSITSGVQTFDVARWFQDVGVGLRSAHTHDDVSTPEEAAVRWLCTDGRLQEIALNNGTVSILHRGIYVGTGVPLVIQDIPSNTFFGAFAYTWFFGGTGLSNQRTALLLRYQLHGCFPSLHGWMSLSATPVGPFPDTGPNAFELPPSPEKEKREANPTVLVAPAPPLESSAQLRADLKVRNPGFARQLGSRSGTPNARRRRIPSASQQYSSDRSPSHSNYKPPSLNNFQPTTSFSAVGDYASELSVAFAIRGNDVDEVRLASLMQRIERRTRLRDVRADISVPAMFILNDNLLFQVVQDVLHYNAGCNLNDFAIIINRCGMHLVLDIIPRHMMPQDFESNNAYRSSIHGFYHSIEERMQLSALFSDTSDFFTEGPSVTSTSWINSVIKRSRLTLLPVGYEVSPQSSPQSPHQLPPSVLGSKVIPSDMSLLLDMSVGHGSADKIPQSPLSNASVEGRILEVWAAFVKEGEDMEPIIVSPSEYLTPTICEALTSSKSAVVLAGSGAATIALPYITHERVSLLKAMKLVNQPLSAAADLGIVKMNSMADEAAALRIQMQREGEMGKKGVVQFSYGGVVDTSHANEWRKKEVKIPCLASLMPKPIEDTSEAERKDLDVTDWQRGLALPNLVGGGGEALSEDTSSSMNKDDPRARCSNSFPPSGAAKPPPKRGGPVIVFTPSVDESSALQGPSTTGKSRTHIYHSTMSTSSSSPLTQHIDLSQRLAEDEYDLTAYEQQLGDPKAELSFLDLTSLDMVTPATKRADFGFMKGLLYISTPADDHVTWLMSGCHAVFPISRVDQMTGILQCGIDIFDALYIEWNHNTMTPEIQQMLQSAREQSQHVPVFFCIITEKSTNLLGSYQTISLTDLPPLPHDAHQDFILTGTSMKDIFFQYRPVIRSKIRLWRLLKDLRGDDFMQYQIKRRIGSGAFGDVYEVSLYASKGRLALKKIPLGAVTTDRMEQLYKESAIMRALDHRNIVQLSHITCNETFLHIFMELCDYSLRDLLDERASASEKSSPSPDALASAGPDGSGRKSSISSRRKSRTTPGLQNSSFSALTGAPSRHSASDPTLTARDVISAVNYLHSHDIVHRDLKPHNILFLNGLAKLADFGTATTVSSRQKSLHTMKGTIPYMAPEVFLGEPYRKPCDIWSLGILIGDILGLRFAHTTLLHYPSLHAFYVSLDQDESMPVVITNFDSSGVQKHFSDEQIDSVKEALQEARKVAKEERAEQDLKKPIFDDQSLSSCGPSTIRTIFCISMHAGLCCSVSRHSLPSSLIELLESTFCRNPDNRMTAEDLLHHPIANEKEWIPTMIAEVAAIMGGLAEQEKEDDSKSNANQMVDLSFSDSGSSGDDEL